MNENFKKEKLYEFLNYEKKRHLELLKDSEDLTGELRLKFLHYSAIQFNQLNWEIRDQYLELLDNYMERKIGSFNFRIKFCERYDSIGKVADVLESKRVLLSPDENSLDFGDFLSKIDTCCKVYSDNPEPFQQECELGDVEFRNEIEKIYSNIQKYAESTSGISDDSRVLRDTMIFFSILSFLTYSFLKPEFFNFVSDIFS